MNRKDFRQAVEIAQDSEESLNRVDIACMDGCALGAYPQTHVTIRQVASLVRYHCQYLGGGWDSVELDNIARIARYKFLTVG